MPQSQFRLKKMAGFEVADQDPAPLFESSSLCGIFDVWSVPTRARACARASYVATVELGANARDPDGAERATPAVPHGASDRKSVV